ncbi:hypothetical protein [Flammeovirga sp. MY04]|nr:hypothetical protein [Flammeovirga sp. MY04]
MSTSFTMSESTLEWGSKILFNEDKKKKEAEKDKATKKSKKEKQS